MATHCASVALRAQAFRKLGLRPPSQRSTCACAGLRVLRAAARARRCARLLQQRARRRARSAKRSSGVARLARAQELARAADLQVARARSRSRRWSRASPSGAPCAVVATAARCTAARTRWPPRRGRRGRAAGAAARGRSARRARSPSATALGTSTPTSITVVATSTLISPAANSAITAAFSAGRHAAVQQADRMPGQRRAAAAACGRGGVLQVERLRSPRSAGRPSRPAGPRADLVADARDHLVAPARRRTAW